MSAVSCCTAVPTLPQSMHLRVLAGVDSGLLLACCAF